MSEHASTAIMCPAAATCTGMQAWWYEDPISGDVRWSWACDRDGSHPGYPSLEAAIDGMRAAHIGSSWETP